jgi:hypothetical protein
MNLNQQWPFVFRFAVAGFAVAVVAALCLDLQAPNVVINVLLLISPGLWLFLERALRTVGQIGSYAVGFSLSVGFAAIANGVFYGLLAVAVTRLRRLLFHRAN